MLTRARVLGGGASYLLITQHTIMLDHLRIHEPLRARRAETITRHEPVRKGKIGGALVACPDVPENDQARAPVDDRRVVRPPAPDVQRRLIDLDVVDQQACATPCAELVTIPMPLTRVTAARFAFVDAQRLREVAAAIVKSNAIPNLAERLRHLQQEGPHHWVIHQQLVAVGPR